MPKHYLALITGTQKKPKEIHLKVRTATYLFSAMNKKHMVKSGQDGKVVRPCVHFISQVHQKYNCL